MSTTPIARMPKPEAGQYEGARKLFLVPTFLMSPEAPEEGQHLLERYWSEVRDHIHNLERSLGQVAHVYHEALYTEGEDGLKVLETLDPKGYSFIQAMCQSTARLEATEDRSLLAESSDWQRCMSVGLVSEKVAKTAMDGYQEATKQRYEQIGTRIGATLKEGEAGALFIREDHRVQFPSDIRVFYVAPPSLDAIKRWIDDQVRTATRDIEESMKAAEGRDASQAESSPDAQESAEAQQPPNSPEAPDTRAVDSE